MGDDVARRFAEQGLEAASEAAAFGFQHVGLSLFIAPDAGEQHPFQIGLKAVRDVTRQTRAVVVHSSDEAGDAQVGIYRLAQLADGIEQGADAFEGEVLALDRHEDVVGGNQRIDGKQVERWRTVNQHPVETLRPAEDVFFQECVAHVFFEQRFVRTGQVGVGGHQPDV